MPVRIKKRGIAVHKTAGVQPDRAWSNPSMSQHEPDNDRSDADGRPWRDEQRLRGLYIEKGLSKADIAAHWDCSEATVYRWLKKALKGRPHGHDCPECGETFPTDRGMRQHYGQSHEGSVAGHPIECAHCGATRRLPECQLNDSGRNFCDNDCRIGWMKERGRVKTKCSVCLATLSRPRWQVEAYEHQFCPDGCLTEWLSERTGESHPLYNGRARFECDWCGDTVPKRPSAPELNHHFCDQDCFGQWLSENRSGPDNPQWEGGEFPYGEGWNDAKKEAVRERDGRECQECGRTEAEHQDLLGTKHPIHHIRKARHFDSPEQRNHLDNLVTLCRGECHSKWEQMAPLRPDTRTADD